MGAAQLDFAHTIVAKRRLNARNKTYARLKPAHGELVEPPYRIRQFPFQSFDKLRMSGEGRHNSTLPIP